ncbi:WXG100 family type VII secretion target [Actinokineospora sp. NPDC004072]
MTSFDIDHNGYLELNEQLLMHVRSVGDILENLNSALRNIPSAARGQATPVWLEAQQNWTRIYQEMQQKLNASTLSSSNVHEIFQNGDNAGARIMLS